MISSHHTGGADEYERRISGHRNGCVARELGGRRDLDENLLASGFYSGICFAD
jgi:hypothetical protein